LARAVVDAPTRHERGLRSRSDLHEVRWPLLRRPLHRRPRQAGHGVRSRARAGRLRREDPAGRCRGEQVPRPPLRRPRLGRAGEARRGREGHRHRAVKEYGIPNLCIAGGVGLNCKMNGELLQSTAIERIFVQPASNDAGTSIGAAMIVAQAHGDRIWNELENVYYGPGFSNADIQKALDGCKVPYEEASDVVRRTADDIAEGK